VTPIIAYCRAAPEVAVDRNPVMIYGVTHPLNRLAAVRHPPCQRDRHLR
jgi:hypothetical protein